MWRDLMIVAPQSKHVYDQHDSSKTKQYILACSFKLDAHNLSPYKDKVFIETYWLFIYQLRVDCTYTGAKSFYQKFDYVNITDLLHT